MLQRYLNQKKRIILDRCNLTKSQRKEFLDVAQLRPEDCTCSYFNASPDLCIQRTDNRVEHPTLTQGKGFIVIKRFAKQVEEPLLCEGFSYVCNVGSLNASDELLRLFGVTK